MTMAKRRQEQSAHLALHCGTGTLWSGTDLAERDRVFAEAEQLQEERARAAEAAEAERLVRVAAHDHQSRVEAEAASVRRQAAFDKLARSHPEVADLIRTILT